MTTSNKTQTISELINSTVFGELVKNDKINVIIKHSTIFSFWEEIVGKKFAKFSKPYLIKYKKLYVTAKNSVIVQELGLYKPKIIKKLNSYSMPLGIEIKDIVFDYKNFYNEEEILYNEDKPKIISKNEIDKIKIDKNTEDEITKSIDKIGFLDDNQKQKLKSKIISSYKVKFLQNNS